MISIAVFPKCWIDDICSHRMSLFEWIQVSVELECEGLELYNLFLESHELSYLSEIRRRIESEGMCMPMMCHSSDFTIPDENARKEEIRKQQEMIRVTAELGGNFCRTLSGQCRPDMPLDQGIDLVVSCIEKCLPTAKSCGVKLVIENHYKDEFWRYPEFAQKREVFLAILERIDSPWLGVQYDPSNTMIAGDDPFDLLDAVLPRLKTMHASDRYLAPGASLDDMRQTDGSLGYPDKLIHGITGRGLNDYDGIFLRLRSIDFDGWISIEDGMNGMDEMKNSVDFLKKMRSKYKEK